MAWSAPFTAVLGATITAASHNTGYRDNLNAIWVYTTAGDMSYASSATALARLAVGADDTVLRSTGTAPSWGNLPFSGALITRTTTQSINDSTETAITFTAETFDVGGYWDAGAPTRLTIPTTGYYIFGGQVSWATNTSGIRDAKLFVNGSVINIETRNPVTGAFAIHHIVTVRSLSATDYVELYGRQTSGGALNLQGTQNLWIRFIGD